jgi:hypothetical protein
VYSDIRREEEEEEEEGAVSLRCCGAGEVSNLKLNFWLPGQDVSHQCSCKRISREKKLPGRLSRVANANFSIRRLEDRKEIW